jgi:hypothetical protein
MEKETFSDRDVVALSNKAFVNIEVDYDKNRNAVNRYNPPGLPMTYVVDSEGEVLGAAIGFLGPREYVDWLARVKDLVPKIAELRKAEKPLELSEAYFKTGAYAQSVKIAEAGLAKAETPELKAKLTARRVEAKLRIDPDDDKSIDELMAIDPEGKFGVRDDALLFQVEWLARHEKPKEALDLVADAVKKFPQSDRMDGLTYYRARLTWLLSGKTDPSIGWLEEWLNKYSDSMYRAWAEADLKEMKAEKK